MLILFLESMQLYFWFQFDISLSFSNFKYITKQVGEKTHIWNDARIDYFSYFLNE